MTSRTQPCTVFWIIVALVMVLVAYPLSFGPACWITSHVERGNEVISRIYQPFMFIWWNGDRPRLDDFLGADISRRFRRKDGSWCGQRRMGTNGVTASSEPHPRIASSRYVPPQTFRRDQVTHYSATTIFASVVGRSSCPCVLSLSSRSRTTVEASCPAGSVGEANDVGLNVCCRPRGSLRSMYRGAVEMRTSSRTNATPGGARTTNSFFHSCPGVH